jgi:putative isomerase
MIFSLTLHLYTQDETTFDVNIVPFSYRGSYMSFTRFQGRGNTPGKLQMLQVSRRSSKIDFFQVEAVRDGKVVETSFKATPEKLILSHGDGMIEICFQSPEIIRFRAKNLGLRLSMERKFYYLPIHKDQFRYMVDNIKFVITKLKGQAEVGKKPVGDKKHKTAYHQFQYDLLPNPDEMAEVIVEEYVSEWQPKEYRLSFDDCVLKTKKEFSEWLGTMPYFPAEYMNRTRQAMYLNWSCLVAPRGWIKREGMLMSKTWMNGIWSWDHCFNAVATSFTNMDLALDQLHVVFDNQDELGALPDGTFENNLQWGHLKPPIHGWTIEQMMKYGEVSDEMINSIYVPLVQWSNFWLNYRDDDRDGVVQQNHGNEAADNATVYDIGLPVESPDLCVHMVYQMDVLSMLAGKLGKWKDSIEWKRKADILQEKFIKELWDGEKFIHKVSITGEYNKDAISFLSYMPIMIGYRLPDEIKDKLVQGIKNYLVTPYGIATESPESKLYQPDGYWRGPIWAPIVHLMVTGIEKAGEPELAKKIAMNFCKTINENGFAENFDATTGKPLRDPSYTWTSSAFLILLHEYSHQK